MAHVHCVHVRGLNSPNVLLRKNHRRPPTVRNDDIVLSTSVQHKILWKLKRSLGGDGLYIYIIYVYARLVVSNVYGGCGGRSGNRPRGTNQPGKVRTFWYLLPCVRALYILYINTVYCCARALYCPVSWWSSRTPDRRTHPAELAKRRPHDLIGFN